MPFRKLPPEASIIGRGTGRASRFLKTQSKPLPENARMYLALLVRGSPARPPVLKNPPWGAGKIRQLPGLCCRGHGYRRQLPGRGYGRHLPRILLPGGLRLHSQSVKSFSLGDSAAFCRSGSFPGGLNHRQGYRKGFRFMMPGSSPGRESGSMFCRASRSGRSREVSGFIFNPSNFVPVAFWYLGRYFLPSRG